MPRRTSRPSVSPVRGRETVLFSATEVTAAEKGFPAHPDRGDETSMSAVTYRSAPIGIGERKYTERTPGEIMAVLD